MKAKEVMEVLQICRKTLYRYTKQGLITTDCCINGQYRYNAESVYKILGQPVPEKYRKAQKNVDFT